MKSDEEIIEWDRWFKMKVPYIDESKLPRCIECGDKVCVCGEDDKWAAHCMSCDNNIGRHGFYHPCASSQQEAADMWTEQNTK